MNFSPTDLYLEPSQIPDGYARAAERLGVQMLPHTLVTGIVLRGDAVAGVATEHGTIRCADRGRCRRRLAARRGRAAGASVRMVPTRHQLMITEPIAGVAPMQPITRIIDANVYVRPDEGGLMLGGYEADPVQYDRAALPARFESPTFRSTSACCAGWPTACASSCRSSSACPARSACACTAAGCRR